jgi:threonyl-tRNA synthetase
MAKTTRSTKASSEDLAPLRHSLAHLLAAAVMELWPDTKRTIGPAIEDGFYFDFEFSKPISDADLPKIEKQMRKILSTWSGFERHELTPAEAKKEYPGNQYKHELIDEFSGKGEKLSFYKSGDYWDLCRGGHAETMKGIDPESFKLMKVAGAYWRGSEKNRMLTRIYGAAFKTKTELDDYLARMKEAEARDHRKLGEALDLFTFSPLVGPGLPLWTPKGTILRNLLDSFVWELRRARGYELVDIPHLTKKELYERSGHWDKFKNELFRITTREGHEFAMKPMNCPHHTQIYARKPWSYRELPQRYASTTKVYRDEQTGELAGLTRVRAITQDDAHVFCRADQAKEEMGKIWDIIDAFYGAVGFTLTPRLSLHDPKNMKAYLGDEATWKKAEDQLRALAKERKIEVPEVIGEAAFYGPKVDFMAKDSIGRQWQVATIQIDMNMPARFELTCTDEHGKPEQVVMLHAAIMGAIERYVAILIEHFAGAFPLWLAPVQVQLIPVGTRHEDACLKLAAEFRAQGLRIEVDLANETVGKKIRQASQQKVPYLIVIGDKEIDSPKLALKVRGEPEVREITKAAFLKHAEKLIAERSLEL